MDKPVFTPLNGVERNIRKLEELFPGVVREAFGKDGRLRKTVDFTLLKQMLSDESTPDSEAPEPYGFTWPGKRAAVTQAHTRPGKILRPVPQESADWERTGNLFIEGDNLEVLKLLQQSYLNKVKCIYIDPPYNTGNGFIYKDDFREKAESFRRRSGQAAGLLTANALTNGRFHSDWLTMMYARLLVARTLLREDGVIFISIDDHEADNLGKLCDEVFGSVNRITRIVWQKAHTRKNSARYFSESHEYIYCYAKHKKTDSADTGWERNLLPRENRDTYRNPDGDPKGPWKPDPITAHNPYGADYRITKPNGVVLTRPRDRYWAFSEENWLRKVQENAVIWGEGDAYPMVKRYLSEVQDGLVPVTWFDREFAGDNAAANRELKELMGRGAIFPYPKPSKLIKRLLQIATGPDDLVLDFFAGSATTAHAVMQLNAEDGGRRRYILVQLPEETPPGSEARMMGFSDLCGIGRERIRRAAGKLRREAGAAGASFDGGFRVFRTDSPNRKDLHRRAEERRQEDLAEAAGDLKEERAGYDLFVQAMLGVGLELSVAIKIYTLEDGITVFEAGEAELLGCFDRDIPESAHREMAERKPVHAVYADRSFRDNEALRSALEWWKIVSRSTTVRVL